jgi:hypothetical protein
MIYKQLNIFVILIGLFFSMLFSVSAAYYQQNYYADYAEHLVNGSSYYTSDAGFQERVNITFEIQDNNDATNYQVKGRNYMANESLWHLDELSGIDVFDSWHNQKDGIMINDPTRVLGVSGNALHFEEWQWVNFGNIYNFEYTDSFSLSSWFNNNGIFYEHTIISKMDDVLYKGYQLELNDGYPFFTFFADIGQGYTISVYGSTQFNDGLWHHIAVTYDGSGFANGIQIYVDAINQSLVINTDALNSQSIHNEGNFALASINGAVLFGAGEIDEASVYSKTLSYDEILARYYATDLFDNFITCTWDNLTYDANAEYSLMFKTVNDVNSTIFVLPYANDNNVSLVPVASNSFIGKGWHSVNISALANYMSPKNLLQIRFWANQTTNISEVYLKKEKYTRDSLIPDANNLEYAYYFEVNRSNEIRFYGNTSENIAYIIINETAYLMNSNSEYFYLSFLNPNREDINFIFNLTDLSNITIFSTSGVMRFRIPFYVDFYIYRDNVQNQPQLYTNQFQYVFLKFESQTPYSYTNSTKWLNSWNTNLLSFLQGNSQMPKDTELALWAAINNGMARIKVYEAGNYSVNLETTKTRSSIPWQYEFIYPQDSGSQYHTKITSIEISPEQYQEISIYANMWDISKSRALWNIVLVAVVIVIYIAAVVLSFYTGNLWIISGVTFGGLLILLNVIKSLTS